MLLAALLVKAKPRDLPILSLALTVSFFKSVLCRRISVVLDTTLLTLPRRRSPSEPGT